MSTDQRPLVLHVVHRFAVGGLENGIVNLINHMPADAYRHAVLAMTEVTDFSQRVKRDDVEFHALDKPPGHAFSLYPRVFRLLRQLRPAVVHTRNIGTLELQLPAWAAGVPARVHGEHGWDVGDLDGSNTSHQRVRRFYRRFVHRQMALSEAQADYLRKRVGVPAERIVRACNGVNTQRFTPAEEGVLPIAGCPFDPARHFIVGTVGRMAPVKDQLTLTQAFIHALHAAPELRERMRLVLIGDGALRQPCQQALADAGVAELAWLPGEREDVPALMRGLHLFALPSLAEGISNTILEAMASGLPVLATAVGGNAELVDGLHTGRLVPAADAAAMASELVALARAPAQAQAMGRAGRICVVSRFSLEAMVAIYQSLYDELLGRNTLAITSPRRS